MNLGELKEKMAELEIRSKRSLGQNFLVSDQVVDRIVHAVRSVRPAFLIEIGPGLGALTDPLAEFHPLLVELDHDLALYWRERNYQVIETDALKMDWDQLTLPENTWLVSNLPYQISTHLVVDRCFGPKRLSGMVLMFQKEVAQRLMASIRTPEYGLLSVMAQTFWDIKKVADASPRDFHPPPKVASRVLKFVRRPVSLELGFLTFVKVAFSHRRKFLLKNLGALGDKNVHWPAFMEEMSIDLKARAEELTPAQFAELYSRGKKK